MVSMANAVSTNSVATKKVAPKKATTTKAVKAKKAPASFRKRGQSRRRFLRLLIDEFVVGPGQVD